MPMWLLSLFLTLGTTPSTYVGLTVALSVFTLLPVTFMNIGTYQVIVTEIMSPAGAPRSEAFAYAVTAQALSHLWVAVVGLISLWTMQVWPREAVAAIRPRSNPPGESGSVPTPR